MSSKAPIRLLMVAVVQEQDLERATNAAAAFDVPVVYLDSTGGFLGNRNATVLIGLPEGLKSSLVEALHKACCQRVEHMNVSMKNVPIPLPTSVTVTVGGATIFAMPVEHFLHSSDCLLWPPIELYVELDDFRETLEEKVDSSQKFLRMFCGCQTHSFQSQLFYIGKQFKIKRLPLP